MEKEWRSKNKKHSDKGLNMRDLANIEELIVLSNLETVNAYLINQGIDKKYRIKELVFEAKKNFEIVKNQKSIENIKNLNYNSKII